MIPEPCRGRPRYDRGQDRHRQIQSEEKRGSGREQPARSPQQRQHDQSGQAVFGEDVAVPDQDQVDQSDRQQDGQPAQQQCRPARVGRQPFELNGEANAEQHRKQRKGLQLDRHGQEVQYRAIQRRCRAAAGGRNCSKMETRNCIVTWMANTPNRARPRNASMASMRSEGFTGAEAGMVGWSGGIVAFRADVGTCNRGAVAQLNRFRARRTR